MSETRFYVYAYYDVLENGLPFYVGKGSGNRYLDHFDLCVSGDTMFYRKLLGMVRKRNQPRVPKLHVGLDEDTAFDIERALILRFGRRDLGTGCLCNHTDGGEGQAGRVMSDETRLRISVSKLGSEITIETRVAVARSRAGHKESVETRTRKRESRLDCVTVCSFDLRTDEVIKTYPSMGSVRDDGFTVTNVSKVVRGERPHHKGLGWRMA